MACPHKGVLQPWDHWTLSASGSDSIRLPASLQETPGPTVRVRHRPSRKGTGVLTGGRVLLPRLALALMALHLKTGLELSSQ